MDSTDYMLVIIIAAGIMTVSGLIIPIIGFIFLLRFWVLCDHVKKIVKILEQGNNKERKG